MKWSQYLPTRCSTWLLGLLVLLPICTPTACYAAKGPQPAAPAAGGGATQVEVVDFRGIPVQGASVKLQESPAAPLPHEIRETTVTMTDTSGRFSPPFDAPKGAILVLEKPNFASMSFYPDKVPPRVILPPAARLMGTVIDDRGVSVTDALIGPVAPPAICEHGPTDVTHPTTNPWRFTRTNNRGFFRVEGLPIHKYEFLVRAPGRQPKVIQAVTGAPFTIMVNTGGTTVTGQVLGTRDRLPQRDVYVMAVTGSGAIRLFEKTDADGRFAFGNLPHQEWVFNVYTGPNTQHHSAQAIEVPSPTGETSVTLLMNQGSSISGRVIDYDTSAPMADFGLTLVGAGGTAPKPSRTDSNGNFHFPDVDALEQFTLRFDPIQYARVLPDGSTADYLDITSEGGADRSNILLELRKKALLQGHVVDVTGTPIADANITITSLDAPLVVMGKEGVEQKARPELHSLTNAAGKFKAGVLPVGLYSVQASKDELLSEPKRVELYTTSTTPLVELRLLPTQPFGGRVLDPGDAIVTGALVTIIPPQGGVPENLADHEVPRFKTTRTNVQGEFEFEGLLPQQEIELRATHPDFLQPATGKFVPGTAASATTAQVALRFPPGSDLNVTVGDANGQPIAGAEVIAHYVLDLQGQQKTRRTTAGGKVRMRSAPVNRLERLVVRHPAFADFEHLQPVPLPQGDFRVTLYRKSTITVKLQGNFAGVDAQKSGHPVALLHVPQSATANPAAPPDEKQFMEHARVESTDGQAQFHDLGPGWYKAALAGGNSFAESESVFLKGDDGDVQLLLSVVASQGLRGKVTDKASGRPIQGASVNVTPAAQYSNPESIAPRTVYSTASGEFAFPDAPGGAIKVRVIAMGYPEFTQTVPATARNTPLNIVLSNEPGALQGRITMNNRPVPHALLVLSEPNSTESPLASSVTDDNGNYALSGFPVGTYVLSLEAPLGETDEMTRRSYNVQVDGPQKRHDVELPLPVAVEGQVTLNGKIPAYPDGTMPQLLFMPSGEGGGDARNVAINANGTFTTQLGPGNYKVGLEDRPGIDVTVPPNGARGLKLEF